MQYSKMSAEQAEALAKRDRNRLVGMSVLVVLVAAAYLLTMNQSRRKAEEAQADAAAQRTSEREVDEDVVTRHEIEGVSASEAFENLSKRRHQDVDDDAMTAQEFEELSVAMKRCHV